MQNLRISKRDSFHEPWDSNHNIVIFTSHAGGEFLLANSSEFL